jgi:hypothetical protein
LRNLTINVPVVLYGCEIWSLTVREKGRQRVFINRVLRRIFRPKRYEVTGNGEDYITKSFMLCTSHYHSGDQVNKSEIGRTCSTYGERRNAYKALVGKPEGRRPLARPRRRWEDNNKMDI